jgi:hypothetical protein
MLRPPSIRQVASGIGDSAPEADRQPRHGSLSWRERRAKADRLGGPVAWSRWIDRRQP